MISSSPVIPEVTTVGLTHVSTGHSLRLLTNIVWVEDQDGIPMSGIEVEVTSLESIEGTPLPIVEPLFKLTYERGFVEFEFRFPLKTRSGVITYTVDGKRLTTSQS